MKGTDAQFKALAAIAAAPRPCPPWQEGDHLPWDDLQFSRRVLEVHLDPTTHMASRGPDVIDRHVEWLEEQLESVPATDGPRHVLEVGCGPGLYCHELARRGLKATGFDFAPAALAWARQTAANEGLDCQFMEADLTRLPDDFAAEVGPVDAVTFWFGDFHGFPDAAVAEFLPRLASCLKPGGLFVLEHQPLEDYEHSDSTNWTSRDRSVFSSAPHLWLEEFFWHEAESTEVHVHWIIDQDSGSLTRYVQCHRAWDEEELVDLLADVGLVEPVYHPPITGIDEQFEFPVLVTRKESMNRHRSGDHA